MTDETVTSFLEAIKLDPLLQERIKSATKVDDVILVAKQAGFAVSAEELRNSQMTILMCVDFESLSQSAEFWPLLDAVTNLLRISTP